MRLYKLPLNLQLFSLPWIWEVLLLFFKSFALWYCYFHFFFWCDLNRRNSNFCGKTNQLHNTVLQYLYVSPHCRKPSPGCPWVKKSGMLWSHIPNTVNVACDDRTSKTATFLLVCFLSLNESTCEKKRIYQKILQKSSTWKLVSSPFVFAKN